MKKNIFFVLGLSSLIAFGLSAETSDRDYTIASAAISSTFPATPSTKQAGYKEIHTKELQNLLNSNSNVILLDARSAQYDDGKRIPGAKSLPSSSSTEQFAAVVPNKDALIVVYCANSRCPLSTALADKLVSLGYTNVQKYPEGLEGWTHAGNKLIKAQ